MSVEEIINNIKLLTLNERLHYFDLVNTIYCKYCGNKHPDNKRCQYWNDE